MMCICCFKNIVSRSCVEARILLLNLVLPEAFERTPAAADVMVLGRLRGYQLYVWRNCVSCSKLCNMVCVCVLFLLLFYGGFWLLFVYFLFFWGGIDTINREIVLLSVSDSANKVRGKKGVLG